MDMTLDSPAQRDAVSDSLQWWGAGLMEMSLTPITIAKPNRTKAGFENQHFHACKSSIRSTSAGKIDINFTSDCKSTWQ